MEPAMEKLETVSPADLIDYILRRYHEPLYGEMAQALKDAKTLAEQPNEPKQKLSELHKLLAELWTELEPHLLKEERILFPMIRNAAEASAAGRPVFPPPHHIVGGPIAVMKMDHLRADEIQNALIELTADILGNAGTSAALKTLCEAVRKMEADLREHIRIEEEHIFPAVDNF